MDALYGVDAFWYALGRFLPELAIVASKVALHGGRAFVHGVQTTLAKRCFYYDVSLDTFRVFSAPSKTSLRAKLHMLSHSPDSTFASVRIFLGGEHVVLGGNWMDAERARHIMDEVYAMCSALEPGGDALYLPLKHCKRQRTLDHVTKLAGQEAVVKRLLHMSKYGLGNDAVLPLACRIAPAKVVAELTWGLPEGVLSPLLRTIRTTTGSHAVAIMAEAKCCAPKMFELLRTIQEMPKADSLMLGLSVVHRCFDDEVHDITTVNALLDTLPGTVSKKVAQQLIEDMSVHNDTGIGVVWRFYRERPSPRDKRPLSASDMFKRQRMRYWSFFSEQMLVEGESLRDDVDLVRKMLMYCEPEAILHMMERHAIRKEHLPEDAFKIATRRKSRKLVMHLTQFSEVEPPRTIEELAKAMSLGRDVLKRFPVDAKMIRRGDLEALLRWKWTSRENGYAIINHLAPVITRSTPGFGEAVRWSVTHSCVNVLATLIRRGELTRVDCDIILAMSDLAGKSNTVHKAIVEVFGK